MPEGIGYGAGALDARDKAVARVESKKEKFKSKLEATDLSIVDKPFSQMKGLDESM